MPRLAAGFRNDDRQADTEQSRKQADDGEAASKHVGPLCWYDNASVPLNRL